MPQTRPALLALEDGRFFRGRSFGAEGETFGELVFSVCMSGYQASVLRRNGVEVRKVPKLSERTHGSTERSIVELITDGDIDLVFNTPGSSEASPRRDGYLIRTTAVLADVPCVTTVAGLTTAVQGIEAQRRGHLATASLQEWAALQG